MTATYAPILVFAYKRPEHLHNLITSLKQNAECKNSDLIIYSDAASDNQSMTGVENVRRYIRTITGFASVQIIERETNWGLANSIIDGVSTQIERYGRVIVLEDDLIVAPYFLQFMNEAFPEAEIVNREDDMRLPGLRAAKESYAPIGYARKFRVSQIWPGEN